MIKLSFESHLSTRENWIMLRSKEGKHFYLPLDKTTPPFPYRDISKDEAEHLIRWLQESIAD